MTMRGQASRCLALLLCFAPFIAACHGAHAQIPCRYEVTVIQYPACGKFDSHTQGLGLNEAGDVVGVITPCTIGDDLGYLWTPENGLQTLPPPQGFTTSRAWDVNDDPPKDGGGGGLVPPSKQVVGTITMGGMIARGFVWSNGNWTILNPPVGGSHSGAFAINSAGKVAGYRWNAQNLAHYAFIWNNGVFTEILPTYGTKSLAWDVNDYDQVVGWMGSSILDTHPFLWEAGVTTDLGLPAGALWGDVSAISNKGIIAGRGIFPNPEGGFSVAKAVLWEKGNWLELGTLPGYAQSAATDLNDSRVVVGGCSGTSGQPAPEHAFLWYDGIMMDLNDLIDPSVAVVRDAHGINDNGEIIATGSVAGGSAALLLKPIWRLTGDTNCDGVVDVDDLLNVINNWGPCSQSICTPDLTNDGLINVLDLVIVIDNWS